jgi:hypothetical protein
VKKYCRGVKVVSSVERDLVFETFSEFVRGGKSQGDVDDYLKMDKALGARGLRFEDVADFVSDTQSKVSLPRLLDLYGKTETSERRVEEICDGLDVLDDLRAQGVEIKDVKALNMKVRDYGGLEGFLEAVSSYKSLGDFRKEQLLVVKDVEMKQARARALEVQNNLLAAQSVAFVSMLGFTRILVEKHSFDILSFEVLVKAAEKFGNVSGILHAMKSYEAKLQTLDSSIEKANRSIGKIEASHKKSLIIQSIVDLIYDTDVTIEHDRFTKTVFLFMAGVQSYLKKNRGMIPGWGSDQEFFFSRYIEIFQKGL